VHDVTNPIAALKALRTNPLEAEDPLTEDALALRFSEQHKDSLRYLKAKATWLRWDGTRWQTERTNLAFDMARRLCREAAKKLGGKSANHAYTAATHAAVERMASADRRQATTIEEWDTDDFSFNVKED
jgi:phage/plasmid-associated DNA primase